MNKSSIFIALTLISGAFSSNLLAQIEKVNITGGTINSEVSGNVSSFKGIPFAAPPVGELRWQAPQAVEPWQGTLEANDYAASCIQDPGMLSMMGIPTAMSEDCLYLNVWSGAQGPTEKRPVMVWIYGGGFAGGTTVSATYDGDYLAEQGVVLVSIAYRTGPMGFLAHPELSRESGEGSGNYGMQDQLAGLHWVQDNIAQFGGDPDNVTIFGESAGGIAVSMLAASPQAKGLFHKVISESGGSFSSPTLPSDVGLGNSTPLLEYAEESGVKFLAALGVSNIDDARNLSAEAVQAGPGTGMGEGFWPVADGNIILGDQYLLYQEGLFIDTPVLIGTNSDEGALFTPPSTPVAAFEGQIRATYGEFAESLLAVYPHSTVSESSQSSRNIFRDATFAWHTLAWAKLQEEYGSSDAYLYYFDHRTAMSPNGANHGDEIAYVFGNLQGQPRAEDIAMSSLMSQYWVNFATSGNPNGPDLPEWPKFNPDTQEAMIMNDKPASAPIPNQEILNALDEYHVHRRSQ